MEAFREFFGRFPDYIDGHEFCHHFPIVNQALIEMLEVFSLTHKVYVRVFRPGRLSLKNGLMWFSNHLAALPSKALISLLIQKGIKSNARLMGFCPYFLKPEYYFEYYFCQIPQKNDIFFCHPGFLSEDASDKLRKYRLQIYNFMMSSRFNDMLEFYGILLENKYKYRHINKKSGRTSL